MKNKPLHNQIYTHAAIQYILCTLFVEKKASSASATKYIIRVSATDAHDTRPLLNNKRTWSIINPIEIVCATKNILQALPTHARCAASVTDAHNTMQQMK